MDVDTTLTTDTVTGPPRLNEPAPAFDALTTHGLTWWI